MITFLKVIYNIMVDEIKIAKVALSLYKNKENDQEYVTIFPDEDQESEGKALAKQWISNNFEQGSEVKSGIVSFDLDDWRKDFGKRFVKNISKNGLMIVWRDLSKNKTIMKGLAPQQGGNIPPIGGGPEIPGLPGEKPNIPTPSPTISSAPPPSSTLSPEKQINAHYDDSDHKISFNEYIDKVIKRVRKSGPLRKTGIKTILGNPRLSIPLTGNLKLDRERRYKDLGEKF
jgi:hypothetical protein